MSAGQHQPWCARPRRGCFLGCVSRDLSVFADGTSQSSVVVRLWAPMNRSGRLPVAMDLEISCGHLGRQVQVALSMEQAELVARNLTDLVAIAKGDRK